MKKIIVLQGPPASGKSTWCKEFVKGKKDWVIVSRDSIRESRGEYWIPEQEDYITKVEESQIEIAMQQGYNIIIDSTNLNQKTIDKWNKLSSNEYEVEFKKFEISYEEALERDKNRPRSVGEKVIKQFFKNYFPELLPIEYYDNRKITKQNTNLPSCIIVDIDGTLALRTNRSPYDYSKVKTDKVNYPVANIVKIFYSKIPVFIVSGRNGTEECIRLTTEWLKENNILYDNLYMRSAKDNRKDCIVKKEIYETYIKDKFNVVAWFDDRDQVVNMVRDELGLLCLQVYYGNF